MTKKIFITIRGGLGDAILSLPVLKELKLALPSSYLSVMISPDAQPLFLGNSYIDELIPFDKKNCSTFTLIKQIWSFDVALLFDLRYRSALVPFLAKVPIRAGIKEKRGLFLNRQLQENLIEKQYEPSNFADIVRLGTGITLQSSKLEDLFLPSIPSQDKATVNTVLTQNGINSVTPYIVAAPFTAMLRKEWPPEYYQSLFDYLQEKYRIKVVLVGGPGANKENYVFKNVIDLIGRLSILQSAEIIARAKFFIGGCCANTHMAAAVNTPIVGLYGPTSPERWAPRKNTTYLSRNPSCKCFRKEKTCPGKHGDCLKAINFQSVIPFCEKFLTSIS